MDDEFHHSIPRNLYRQSSIETPLTPSIPSDSEFEHDDQKNSRSMKNNKSGANPASINKLRDRFENVGIIKVMPDSGPTTSSENIIAASKNKEPTVKKNPPPIPKRGEFLKNQLTSTNAMIIGEIQSLHEAKVDSIKNSRMEIKSQNAIAASNEMKNMGPSTKGDEKPGVEFISTEFVSSMKSRPPPVKPRSDSIQKQSSSVSLVNELSGKYEESRPINAVVESGANQTIYETIPELDDGAKANVVSYDDSKKTTRTMDHQGSVSTLKVMASPRPKSPRPVPLSAKKDEKEESFWEKIGTLGRKKQIKEVQEVQEEGKYAIDYPGLAANPEMPPEEYTLDENEERSMADPKSLEDPKLQELIFFLIEWINDELADQRIIVKDIAEDLYDGQVLQKLLESLTGGKLDVPEVTQSEEGQKQKLAVVLSAANRVLDCHPPYKWSVDSVHSKNIVSILHLLVKLARQFRAPVRLPERVAIQVVVVRKKDGQLIHRTVREEITSTYEDLGMRCERDAFDALFDRAPEKIAVVKKSLVTFVNKHLSKVHLEVTELDTQFHDGVFLILLLGLLEGFFVPLGSFHLTPKTHDQKVHNVLFAFDLMQEIGLLKPKARPEDIVNLDLKSTLRVLYNLFMKYKGMN